MWYMMLLWMWLGMPDQDQVAEAKVVGNIREYAKHGGIVRFEKGKFDEVKKEAEKHNFKVELVHPRLPTIATLKVKRPFECAMEYQAALNKVAKSKHVLGISPNSEMKLIK